MRRLTIIVFTTAMLLLTACQNSTTVHHHGLDRGFLPTDESLTVSQDGVTTAYGYVYDANQNAKIDDADYRPAVLAARRGEMINAFTTLEAAGMRADELTKMLGVGDVTSEITPDDLPRYGAHLDAIRVINALALSRSRSVHDAFDTLRRNVTRGRELIARGLAENWDKAIIQITGSDINRITTAQKSDFTELLALLQGYADGKYASMASSEQSSDQSSFASQVSSAVSSSSVSSTPAPVDCVGAFDPLSDWGECSQACGGGEQSRNVRYVISTPAAHGGTACPYADGYLKSETQACNTFACAVDCVGSFGSWSSWSECSEYCGGGEQSRTRTYTITQAAQNGGTQCPYSNGYEDTDTQACNTQSCAGTDPLPKTGQTVTYTDYDDGWYQTGETRSYSRSNDIVTDHVTGLMWQDDAEAASVKLNWEGAKEYCEQLGESSSSSSMSSGNSSSSGGIFPAPLASQEDMNSENISELLLGVCLPGAPCSVQYYTDWRLPSIDELILITDSGRDDPAIDPVFQNVATSDYWSSTTYASGTSLAWNVDFGYGSDYRGDKTHTYYVRCVRGGQ